jgi:hypothetical protein
MSDLNESWYTHAWWWEEEAYWDLGLQVKDQGHIVHPHVRNSAFAPLVRYWFLFYIILTQPELSSFKHGGILIETKGGNSQANKI